MQLHHLHPPHAPDPGINRGAVVAIGTFDGLHAGHQRLFEAAQAKAHDLQTLSAVFTFVEHPRKVLHPGAALPLLTPWGEKQQRLASLGLDACFAVHFTAAMSELTPEAFVDQILCRDLKVAAIVTGFNFRFGHQQAGTPERLVELGNARGVPVEVVPPVQDAHGAISSSRIRNLIQLGHLEEAKRLLGYAYTLSGTVVHGDKRGRSIGFPTANLAVPADKLLPAFGVYACTARWKGQSFPAVANIGVRPTVRGTDTRIEIHLLEGGCDLYGETLNVALLHHIRGEQNFQSLEALRNQIAHDCERARALTR